MDKTQNFMSHLDKAKAEKIKIEEANKNLALMMSYISKVVIFFIQNAIVYLGYFILTKKISLLEFNYFEFLALHLSVYTIFTIIRNFFKPFNNV